MKFGIQMYLFRNKHITKKQNLRTISKVAAMGWDCIELFGCQNIPADELLKAVGGCEIINPLMWHKNFSEEKLGKTCEWLKGIGAKSAAFSSIPVLHPDAAIYREYNPKYKKIAKTMADNGLTLCHHNHREEYTVMDGKVGIDILLDGVSPYCLEIDTYWAKEAGIDPIDLMEERKEHLRYVHLKDKKAGAKKFCALGDGKMNNRAIVEKARELGVEYVVLDLDNSDTDAFEAAKKSLEWLRKNFG